MPRQTLSSQSIKGKKSENELKKKSSRTNNVRKCNKKQTKVCSSNSTKKPSKKTSNKSTKKRINKESKKQMKKVATTSVKNLLAEPQDVTQTTKARKRRLANDDGVVNHNKINDIADTEKIAKESAKSRQMLKEQEPPKKRKKLSLFAKCKISRKTKQSNSEDVATGIPFNKLTTSAQFNDIKIICYIKRISAIPGKRLTIHGVVDGQCIIITGKARTITIHQDHCIDKWYMVSGGAVIIYQGVKQIEISSQTIITPVKQAARPTVAFQKMKNIIQDFEQLNTIPDNLHAQLYIAGYVEDIGKEESRGANRVIVITIRDINGIGINVNLWHEQDRLMAEKMKLNNTIVLTGWKLVKAPTLSVNNNGMIFIKEELPQSVQHDIMIKNLSEIDYQRIGKLSPVLSVTQALQSAFTGVKPQSNTDFYILQNAKIIEIGRLFSFKDSEGKELQQRWGGAMLDSSGIERELDVEKDDINYFLRLTIQDLDKEATKLYVTGFKQAGLDLFSMSAKMLWVCMQEENLEVGDLVDQLSSRGINIFVTAYVNKQDKLSWTFKKVKETYPIIDDQNPVN